MEGVHSKIKFLAIFSEKNRIGRVKMVLTRKRKVINRQKPILLKLAHYIIELSKGDSQCHSEI